MISARNQRRIGMKKVRARVANPLVRRIVKAELEHGGSTEVYRLDDDGAGRQLFFDVSAMKRWVSEHAEIHAVPPDMARAQHLVESGAVDLGHIANHTIKTDPEPIIICRGLPCGDQIVDGAHRFVAFCVGTAQFGLDLTFPGYVLLPNEWGPFVIPASVARACGAE